MTLQKLKVAALQHEQREEWGAAIELYRQAIRDADGGAEGGDPSLFNRIGDLAHKSGDDAAACEAWEQAVIRYGDLGFLNSAIALGGKILRVNPGRLHTYLELARLQARKRVLYDVRSNLQVYLDQMAATGHAAAARTAVEKLGKEFPGWRDLDALLNQLLEREGATEATGEHHAEPREAGRELVFLDTAPAPTEPERGAALGPGTGSSGEFATAGDRSAIAGFEPTHDDPHPAMAAADASGTIEGLVGVAPAIAQTQPLEGLDAVGGDRATGVVDPIAGLESSTVVPPLPEDIGADLVYIHSDVRPPMPAPATDDPLGQRLAAHALLEHGDRAGGLAGLDRSLALYLDQSEWLHAYQVASELVQAEPAAIARHQTRVEIAARLRDTAKLCDAYADLGDALLREGAPDKAVAVYRRVLELNDGDTRARAALRAMAPDSKTDEESSGFIDLGAMLIDDHPRSTRMRTETPDVAPDENDTFRDALAEFKRALDQNLPIEDHQAHYDLGIAFKEMGLFDEAISEFQKALRAPQVRLRTSEALGEVFFEQGRPAVAETVLRSVENSPEGDAEKIGVLYWLGRALDAQGKHADAGAYYQRIIAVDVGFRDAGERLRQAGPGGAP
ncbi:MAG: tetratricopeptide repeat protein [Gemmatimonadales bacterium]